MKKYQFYQLEKRNTQYHYKEFRKPCAWPKKSTIFVESTYDSFWASGIDKKGPAHTDASVWPGKSVLEDIIGFF